MKAVALLSGGMDSCVCAAMAREKHGSNNLALLHASYGQRTEKRERRAFQEVADFYGVRERLMIQLDHFRAIGGSALTDPKIQVPENKLVQPGAGAIPVTYVPFRNAHFLSAAVSWAEAIGAGAIYIGAVEEDSSGYPDCRPAYYQAFNQAIQAGTKEGKIRIVTLGLELGAPFDLTWSCYSREERACGVCESCVLRLRAFAAAGARDPIPYEQVAEHHRQ